MMILKQADVTKENYGKKYSKWWTKFQKLSKAILEKVKVLAESKKAMKEEL